MTIRPPQRILTEILLRKDRLTEAIRTAIDHALTAAEVGCVGNPGEVDRLVYFFLEGLPAIEGQFNQILQETRVRTTLSGIFCHSTPQVEPIPLSPIGRPGCELGDILFLVTYGGRIYTHFLGNAMLVQAKEELRTVGGTQSHLYEQASGFTYRTPADLASKTRSLANCEFALWYWGFQAEFWHQRAPWDTAGLTARPNSGNHSVQPFEKVLMDLICGVNGRRVKALAAEDWDRGWSRIVDDLIRVTAKSAFRRQNAYVSRDRKPLRGEEITRVLQRSAGTPDAPSLVRCSLDRIFGFFDHELGDIGKHLTGESRRFRRDKFLSKFDDEEPPEKKGDDRDDPPPPPLGNERPEGPKDGGGCSFVIIDFSTATDSTE